MAHPIRPGALESIIHTYENVKNALDVAEATLKALNDELVPLENRRDALRQHHDEQSKLVDDLQGRLMVSGLFDVIGDEELNRSCRQCSTQAHCPPAPLKAKSFPRKIKVTCFSNVI